VNRLAPVLARPSSRQSVRRLAGATARGAAYCALLIPVGVAALGRPGIAPSWWRHLRTRLLRAAPVPPGQPRTTAVLGHAASSILLGSVALVPLGIQVLLVLRGALYGLVDRGPYDHSWGGPSRAGAWVAHFLVGVPISLAGLAALVGIAAVHQRLTASLDGVPPARWVKPAVVLIGLAAALFVVAWSRQL
jgi:hypothetical protein